MAEASPAPATEAVTTAPPAQGFGAALRDERVRQGLTREEIAARLRLPSRQIDALEAERLDAFPAGPFLRGFVRNYAKSLGIEDRSLLADLQARTSLAPVGSLDLGTTRLAQPTEGLPRRLVLWGGMVALGAFALIGLIVSRTLPAERVVPSPALVAAAPPASDPVVAPAVPLSPPAAGPAAENVPAPVAVPMLRIVIGVRPSWIEVTQADGRLLASGVQPAGADLKLDGSKPLRLVIGNASGVTVEADGQRIALAPNPQSDVARLTLD